MSIKFHFTQTILNFGTKFAQKEYFSSKATLTILIFLEQIFPKKSISSLKQRKMNTTIELLIFELV